MSLRSAAVALLAVVALAGCSQGTSTSASSTSETSAATTSSATSSPTGSESAGEATATETAGSGSITCGQWRDAEHEEKLAAATAFLTSKGQPAETADATMASVDIDVYCATGAKPDDPIEPGFKVN